MPKRRLKSKLRLAVFMAVLVVLFAGGFGLANNFLWPWITGDNQAAGDPEQDEDLTELPGISVLMMGVDERENDKSQRTDTMILANINNEEKRISLLSIPRDTKVYLPGYGNNKINAANYYGGPEMAMQVVSDLTGVPVDYYVTTNFNGFKDIVDDLGGVTINVEQNMRHTERAYGGEYNIDLQQGVQKLDGNQALMFARYRDYAQGDISRTQNQLKLLTAIGDEAMKPAVVTKLPKLVPSIYRNVDTNMGLKQLLAMAMAAKNLDNLQMATQTLPGYFLNEPGASYWYVEPQDAREVTMALFEEGKVVDIVKGAMGDETLSGGSKQVAMEQSAAVQQPASGQTESGAAPAPETGNNAGNNEDIQGDGNAAPGKTNAAPSPDQGAEAGGNSNANQDFLERNGFTEAETGVPPGAVPSPGAVSSGVTPPPEQQHQVKIIIR